MNGNLVRSRTTMLTAGFLMLMMVGIPTGVLTGGEDDSIGSADTASGFGPGDRTIIIGYPNFQSNMATLNPLLYTMGEEMDVIWPCYSTLLTYDVNNNPVGDLATWWDISPDGTLYHFKITTYAKFYNRLDPAAIHPLTAYDIIFTYYLVQNNSNNLQSYFPIIDGKYVISDMWAVGNYEFYMRTTAPFAPMFAGLTTIPILPEYIWSGQKLTWPNYDIKAGIPPCVGSGPWYYALNGLPSAGSAELDRSPSWYATEERGWQVHPSKLIYKTETNVDTALADLTTGAIDIDGFPTSIQYLNTIPKITGVSQWGPITNAVYEFNMNQMSNAQRAALGGTFKSGSSNQLLLDPVVKTAMMMCIDKQNWVSVFLDGLGAPADSLIGPNNRFHYDYGSRPGETAIVFDPAGARTMLNQAGWQYDMSGVKNPNATPLCKVGGTDPLRFRYYTLYDGLDESLWNTGAQMIANWSWSAGIDLKTLYDQKSMSFMNGAWAAADYDVWLWDWWFTVLSEASLDIMEVLTTGAIGTWSDCYWSNATFDNLYNQSLFQADFATRYETLADMQSLAYIYSGCDPVAYRADLYAATSGGPEHWTNWGNWTQHSLLRPDQDLPWLYMRISPDAAQGENPAPAITSMQPSYSGQVNTSISFTGSATDNDAMLYRWFWGDGSKSDWMTYTTGANAGHTYARDGIFTAWLAVRESGTADNFTVVSQTQVTVVDLSNFAPTNVDFTDWPSNPDSGTSVHLNGTALDSNGDPMSFSWNFGDGHTALGQNVTHQFTEGLSSYTVTLSVDDGHIGTGARPVVMTHLIPVYNNTAPTCIVPAYPHVVWKTPTNFTITSYDPDTRDSHRYTWIWGDGSTTVTTTTYATHSYSIKSSYTLTVWADDLTGLPGHNVSGSNNVLVSGTNTAPWLRAFTVSTQNAQIGQWVTFTGSATDNDSDILWYTFDFGDGNLAYVSGYSSPTIPLNLSVSYYYTMPGTFTAYLTVTDNYTAIPPTSPPLPMNIIIGNVAPVPSALPVVRVTMVYDGTYTASATDADGDTLRYTWDFGAGNIVVGNPAHFAYPVDGTFFYRVYVDDLTGYVGHNVSVGNWAYVSTDFTLNLAAGWNLVTVPPTGFGYKASTLGLANGDLVSGFNPATGTYTQNFVVGSSPSFMDFAIAASTGYWIHTNGVETLHLYGMYSSVAMSRSLSFPTGTGWAIIALNTDNTTWKASMIPGWYTGVAITMVAKYNPAGGTYSTYIKGVPPTDFTLTPGQAYWVYCTANGTLTYTP